MTAKNDITGDEIKSRSASEAYRDNWDKIFSKKEVCPTCNQPPKENCKAKPCQVVEQVISAE